MKLNIEENGATMKFFSRAGLGAIAALGFGAWTAGTGFVALSILNDGCVNWSSRIVLALVSVIYIYVLGYVIASLHDHGKNCDANWRNAAILGCKKKPEPYQPLTFKEETVEELLTPRVETINPTRKPKRGRPKLEKPEPKEGNALDLEYDENTR